MGLHRIFLLPVELLYVLENPRLALDKTMCKRPICKPHTHDELQAVKITIPGLCIGGLR